MLHKYFAGKVPAPSLLDLGLKSRLMQVQREIEADYSSLNFSGALSSVWEVIGAANRLIEAEKPWAKAKNGLLDEVAALLHELLAVCQWCAVALAPVMPTACAALWKTLGIEEPLSWLNGVQTLLPEGHSCSLPAPLFPKIPAANLAPVSAPGASNNVASLPMNESIPMPNLTAVSSENVASVPTAGEITPATNLITIDDFSRMELRVGKVLEAERVLKADKLLRLQVDLGSEQRQILAGIALHYNPQDLIGKTVVIVANLAPRILRGYESQGMILAASNDGEDGQFALLTVDNSMEPGSNIR